MYKPDAPLFGPEGPLDAYRAVELEYKVVRGSTFGAIVVLATLVAFIYFRIHHENAMSWKKQPEIEREVTTFRVRYEGKVYFVNFDHESNAWAVWGADFHLIGTKKVIKENPGKPQVTFNRAKYVLKTKIKYGKSN
jgi:hypothetical protein